MKNSKLVHRVVLKIIRLYQHTASPDHGLLHVFFPFGVCRYEQSCSAYTYQAVREHGLKGLWLGLKRVSTCHPFAKV